MDLETKLQLLKFTDNYWTILPEEIKELILKFKDSLEFIERRESASNHALCKQIRMYGEFRQKWQIGHFQCRPMRFDESHTLTEGNGCSLGDKCDHIRIFSFYHDLRGVIKKCFLGLSLRNAIASCDYQRATFGNELHFDFIVLY